MIAAGDLRTIELLADLSDERLQEILKGGRELHIKAGEVLFRQDEHAQFFTLVLDGLLESTRTVAGEELVLVEHGPGGFLGAISLLSGKPYRASTHAVTDSHLFLVEPEAFRRLVVEEPAVFEGALAIFAPALDRVASLDRDREKLLALGKISAGLAHELNNPAAAAQRAVAELREADDRARAALAALASSGVPADALGRLCALAAEAIDRAQDGRELDPLQRSDREAELAERLAARGLAAPHDVAAVLTEAGLDEVWVDEMLAEAGSTDAEASLEWIASRLTAARLARELEESTQRISQLVNSVRQYSHLDQAPRQTVDIHDGLESTLTVLDHKLRDSRIEIVREYDRSLPHVDAYPAELNQVWTNLIDNAIGALDGGRITLRTSRQGSHVVVEVEDSGPGIPEDVRTRIFEPFFTTKPPGKGSGLGLDIAHRIVLRHHGEIKLKPVERGACFQVLLPTGG